MISKKIMRIVRGRSAKCVTQIRKGKASNFAAMSKYSLDSLESIEEEDSLEKNISMNSDNDNDNVSNLKVIESTDKIIENAPFYLNPALLMSLRISDNVTETNGTVRGTSGDRCARTTDGRNSIIASGRGFARRQECRARDEPWICIRRRNAVVDIEGWREEGDAIRRRPRCRTPSLTTERRSPGVRNSSSKCSLHSGGDVGVASMKADKKLDNKLTPWSRGPKRVSSYLELYRRRFSIPRYSRIQSPEGSTLSICGDSQLEELSLDEGRSILPGTSRDDSSELSFYRRFVEGDIKVNKRSVSDSKLKKPTYRPYTIEDYRSLSVPRLDRSLGPDKEELQVKREWLMRRRSYGDSVSARNREQILHRARRLKDHENFRISEADSATHERLLKHSSGYPKERVTLCEVSPPRKAETLEKTSNFDLSSVSLVEDPYLEALRQRHLQERKLADRLMRQVLDSRSNSDK